MTEQPVRVPATPSHEDDGDWDGSEWAGEARDPGTHHGERWNKAEWVGDQGEGAPRPIPRDEMAEGETSISGDRHPPSEQHWSDAAAAGPSGRPTRP